MESKPKWLETLERNVDLPAYLGQHGYEVQRRPDVAIADGIAMAKASTGEVLLLKKQAGEAWGYANLHQPQDRGTVSDFLSRRNGLSVPQVAERVVALAEAVPRDPDAARYRAFQRNLPPTLAAAKREHLSAMEAERGTVATLERLGVPKGTFDEWRFGAVRTSEAMAKVMSDPPDLWASKYRPTDKKVVFAEQPIDAIAYEKHHGKQVSCYMATGRQLSDDMKKKIAHVLCEVPAGVTVVLAFGRDERGQQLAEQIRALAPTLKMERQAPDFGTRWSTQLQLEQRHVRSLARPPQALGR